MRNKKCAACSEYKRCKEDSSSWVFFIIGMVATIAVRMVTVLVHINPVYGQVSWYIGVIGFFIFFAYKFRIERARYKLILKQKLMDKLSREEVITQEDRRLISSILCALSSNKDRINYLLIFISSALAIIIAVYFDFIKKG